MSRIIIALVIALAAASCADDPDIRAVNPNSGEIATFSSANQVPSGWVVCPPGSDCPLFPCDGLTETDCLTRSDCEAVYEPCSGQPKFLECRPAAPPPGVCAIEGESCSNTGCCDGLSCCSGVPVPAGAEYCTEGGCPISDRNRKHTIVAVNTDDVLERLGKLDVATWTYNFENGVRHMGPMAQDFAAAFGLGATDRRIYTVDADGVALASIQALLHRVEALQGTNTSLERENSALRDRLGAVEKRTARLERSTR